MNDARLHDRFRPDRLDRVRQPFQSVAHDEEHIPHAPVLQIDQDTHPKLRALTAGAGPQAQNVLAAVHRDPDGRVDRPVRDLTLADLDDDGVNEHGHVDAVEWPRRPVVHLRDDFVGDPRDRLFRHRRPVNLREMRGDLPGGHAFRIQRQISSTSVSRRCRFFTICGSNVPSRSRGTSMRTSPAASEITVLPSATIAAAAACSGDICRLSPSVFLRGLTTFDVITHGAHPAGP